MLKKFMAVLTSVAIAITAFAPSIYAEQPIENADSTEYIALGDSIAHGYGLNDIENECYPALFAKKNNLSYKNYGVDGLTSAQLLERINNGDYPISGSAVITVSIGSNDLLQPVLKIIAGELGIDSEQNPDLNKAIIDKINYLMENETTNQLVLRFTEIKDKLNNNAELNAACDNFAKNNLPQIAEAIKKAEPDAQLIFTNIYNPYKNNKVILPVSATSILSYDLGALCQPYIDRINTGFETTGNKYGFSVADLSHNFDRPGYINASLDMRNMDTFSFDPHPTRFGHVMINYCIGQNYVVPDKPIVIPETKPIYGDVDNDGQLTSADSALVLQYALNQSSVEFNYEEIVKADVTGNGKIDASDSASILQKVLNSAFVFPVEA